jgi:thioredoxin reductase (NADPH)
MWDVIVVGGGPAGISAAVYLKRFRLDVSIIMKDRGTLARTEHIENYYGFPEPISGTDLFDRGIMQAKNMDIPIIQEEVLGIDYDDNFTLKTNQGEHRAKSVFLATGAHRVLLKAKGFKDFLGKGISYCAVCDGFLYRNKTIGVVGNGAFMREELEVLENFAKALYVFTNDQPLTTTIDSVPVISEPIVALEGQEHLERVVTDKQKYDIDALFIAMGTPSAADFALRMGAFIENNAIVVDENYMTNIPGLFAGGDCIGGWMQIAKAVDDGAKAAVAINKHLKKAAN